MDVKIWPKESVHRGTHDTITLIRGVGGSMRRTGHSFHLTEWIWKLLLLQGRLSTFSILTLLTFRQDEGYKGCLECEFRKMIIKAQGRGI